ncbi:hypothetical protein SDC9_79518 [bioreactor metagenome]|uniref:Uncharacterized protein n=1 Tax=bioreactor metagenome TaxID=1076179 RepID=A0A644YYN6_9ZZZZ|nr:hypothetical protein [Aminivibrio sp.]MEA4951957.1 hypothetical protein [Aminivibrio sp.]
MNATTRNRVEVLELKAKYEALLKERKMDDQTERGIQLLVEDPEGQRLIARTFERMHELLSEHKG